MGKIIKKGTQGAVKEYVSRAKALKRLQLTLKDFRRLCILKGIYPREPPQSLRRQHKTYYHVKDIAFLKSESILDTFRQRRAHLKKIKKAVQRGDRLKAGKLKTRTPKDNLDHLVKERYPTFSDALNDLDDPLCLVSLFASFPAHKDLHIPNTLINNCQKLINQFLVYVASHHALRKVFLSIKGIYYQAIIQGSTITWIMPYPIQAALPLDVDYRVMMTFIEFYQVLLRFVNFKLLGSELSITNVGDVIRQIQTEQQNQNQLEVEEAFKQDPLIQQMQEEKQQKEKYSKLFHGFTFYLYPEVPKQSLEFVILSFGGNAIWAHDTKDSKENDPTITHIITERNIKKQPKRELIQPQWVYDSINQLQLLSCSEYEPDKTLPPHVSPFEEVNIDEYESEEEDEQDQQKQKRNKRKLTQQQKDQKEKDKLAETMLSRKNKRLYDMIKRKEQENKNKKDKIKQKKQQIEQIQEE